MAEDTRLPQTVYVHLGTLGRCSIRAGGGLSRAPVACGVRHAQDEYNMRSSAHARSQEPRSRFAGGLGPVFAAHTLPKPAPLGEASSARHGLALPRRLAERAILTMGVLYLLWACYTYYGRAVLTMSVLYLL